MPKKKWTVAKSTASSFPALFPSCAPHHSTTITAIALLHLTIFVITQEEQEDAIIHLPTLLLVIVTITTTTTHHPIHHLPIQAITWVTIRLPIHRPIIRTIRRPIQGIIRRLLTILAITILATTHRPLTTITRRLPTRVTTPTGTTIRHHPTTLLILPTIPAIIP